MKTSIFLWLCVIGLVAFELIAAGQTKPIIEWVSIPAGTFTMGSPESEVERSKNETQHQVMLSAFMMSKYEITFDQYDLFCDATGRKKPGDEGWWTKRPG